MTSTEMIGVGLTVIGSKDILLKILGPTADYLGQELKSVVDKCNINLDNIFINAANKLGSRLELKGEVGSRVLKHIYDEGRFCEEALTIEYYGGILASSKSEHSRDDRALAVLSVVRDLSTYQLRLHYLVYALLHRLYKNTNRQFGIERREMKIFIPVSVYLAGMDFYENEDIDMILNHSIFGLARHSLIDDDYNVGVEKSVSNVMGREKGFLITPTFFGVELYLWANGLQHINVVDFFHSDVDEMVKEVHIIDGALADYGS